MHSDSIVPHLKLAISKPLQSNAYPISIILHAQQFLRQEISKFQALLALLSHDILIPNLVLKANMKTFNILMLDKNSLCQFITTCFCVELEKEDE